MAGGEEQRDQEREPEVKDKAIYEHVDVYVNRAFTRKHYSSSPIQELNIRKEIPISIKREDILSPATTGSDKPKER